MSKKVFEVTQAGYSIQADVSLIGKDLLIALTGGDNPHIGTITCLGKEVAQEITRFPSHHGRLHKDVVLSDCLLKHITPYLAGTCVITAGVHVNGISKEQIKASFEMTEILGKKIARWLKNADFPTEEPRYDHYHKTYNG